MSELPLEPKEPKVVGMCAWCGDEIIRGDQAYKGENGMLVHGECIVDMLLKLLGEERLAKKCGFELTFA